MHLIVRITLLVALASVLVHSQGARGGGGARGGSGGFRGESFYKAEEATIALSLQVVELVPAAVVEVVPVMTVARMRASLLGV